MGFLDNFLNLMRLNPDEEDDFLNEEYDLDEEYEKEKPVKSSFKAKKEPIKEETVTDEFKEKPVKPTAKVTPIRPVKRSSTSSTSSNMEVCVINQLLWKMLEKLQKRC